MHSSPCNYSLRMHPWATVGQSTWSSNAVPLRHYVTWVSSTTRVPAVHWTLPFLYLKLIEKIVGEAVGLCTHSVQPQAVEDRTIGSQGGPHPVFLARESPLCPLALWPLNSPVPSQTSTNEYQMGEGYLSMGWRKKMKLQHREHRASHTRYPLARASEIERF